MKHAYDYLYSNKWKLFQVVEHNIIPEKLLSAYIRLQYRIWEDWRERERIIYWCYAWVMYVGWATTCGGWEYSTYPGNEEKCLQGFVCLAPAGFFLGISIIPYVIYHSCPCYVSVKWYGAMYAGSAFYQH